MVKLFAQRGERRHELFRVSVLGFQVRGHRGILLVAKPGIVVSEDDSVQSRLGVDDGRNRRLQEFAFGHQFQFRAFSRQLSAFSRTSATQSAAFPKHPHLQMLVSVVGTGRTQRAES